MLGRLRGAWRELDADQRWAGLVSVALLATMFLPWYRKSVVLSNDLVKENLSAFGVFTFVEAAVLLVALGVFLLLFARGEKRAFHLPGGDGTVIFAAGLWAGLLLLWRVFDRPGLDDPREDIGITWGFFFAFLAAGALAATGWRIRAAGRPEPPLRRAGDEVEADDGPRTGATQVAPRRRRPAPPRLEGATQQLTLDDAATHVAPDDDPAEAPTRAAPRERPAPPPLRPGVFDHAADDDEPLRPGEIPRAPDG